MQGIKADIKGMSRGEMEEWAAGMGMSPYRGRQIRQWLFSKLADSFEEMTNISKAHRAVLAAHARIRHVEPLEVLTSRDGTRKFLFGLLDGCTIESVLIPERDHWTLCISTQVGCAMGCRFCLTAAQGWTRNLTAAEILDQVVAVRRTLARPERLTNIVFMGMGEPLANAPAVFKALETLLADDGMNFSHRRVTLSTCGLAPQIRRLGETVDVGLAVSLNAADNRTRDFLMPVNRTYPLEVLLAACREFPLPHRRMITFEYILMAGINDRDRDVRALKQLLKGMRAKINLIPFNPHPGAPFAPPSLERVEAIQQELIRSRFTAMVRKSKGADILAACGQLSGARNRRAASEVEAPPPEQMKHGTIQPGTEPPISLERRTQ